MRLFPRLFIAQVPVLAGALLIGAVATVPAMAEAGRAPMDDAELHRFPAPPPLELSDAQRARIRAAVRQQNAHPSAKAKKQAAGFQPSVGAKLPKALNAHALPRPLVNEMPALKSYTYVLLDEQVLIINPMTRAIAEVLN
jgi:hypothetical protein